MKTIIKQLSAAVLLCFLAISALPAQNTAPLEAATNSAGQSNATQKLDKEIEKERSDRSDNNRRLMIHDLSWNSWVVFAIVFGVGGLWLDNLRDKRRHETIRVMIEKGTPVTPDLLDGLRKKSRFGKHTYDPQGYLCWGITEVLVAVALLLAYSSGGAHTAGWIVLAVGAANLILWFIDRAHSNGRQTK